MGLFALTIPVLLFLTAVLCFLIYEEWWRVDAKICSSFGPVEMEKCDEGENAEGYQGLCWFVISVVCCVFIGLVLGPKILSGLAILHNVNQVYRSSLQLHVFLFAVLVFGVVFYTYSITLLIYQTSCGDSSWQLEPTIPQGEVWHWDFNQAERVLVFFDVGMILWHLSFLVHAVEYVSAYSTKSWRFSRSSRFLITKALYPLFRYHLGSVLLASVIVPVGRLPRNLLVGIKSLVKGCPIGPFKHMTSNGLCFQAIMGGRSYYRSCKLSSDLFERNKDSKASEAINSGNYIVWVFQLLIILVAPVYVMYWIQHKNLTYRDKTTKEISSVIAMGFYALFFSWFLSNLYACFVRGLFHGSIISHIIDSEIHGKKVDNVSFAAERNEEFHPSEMHLDQSEEKKQAQFGIPPQTQEDPSKDVDLSNPPPSRGEPARQRKHSREYSPRADVVIPEAPALAQMSGDVPQPSGEGRHSPSSPESSEHRQDLS